MTIGKRVADDLYLHNTAVADALDERLYSFAKLARDLIESVNNPNVLKVSFRTNKLSWLEYEDFDGMPFPRLLASWTFDMGNDAAPSYRSYRSSLNPPILHRKELLVDPLYPGRDDWIELTKVAESLGLFENKTTIGFQLNWTKIIESKGYQLNGTTFQPIGNNCASEVDSLLTSDGVTIHRHLTALNRTCLSAPVQMLMRHGLLVDEKTTFFDYGCGRGNDIEALRQTGFDAHGWDPHYAKDSPKFPSDVVNLGFVINVIEDPAERVDALDQAFRLAKRVLSFGVMLSSPDINGKSYQDGVLTSRSTFQKYFTQGEIKAFVEDVLHTEAFMVGPGVGFVFADKIIQQTFESARYRNVGIAQRLSGAICLRAGKHRSSEFSGHNSPSQRLFEQHKPLLDSLWNKSLDLGRLPEIQEIQETEDVMVIESSFGTFNRALRLVVTNFDMTALAQARTARTDDLTVYLAIQQFSKRVKYRNIEPRIQRDIKAFYGDYNSAQSAAYKLLTDCANVLLLSEACVLAASEGLGWLEDGHSLQLHISLVERLPAILRVYVACGLVLWDAISEVQLIKIHIGSGKLSLMEFENFDNSPLPPLQKRIKVNLRELDYSIFDYGSVEHPKPLLYFKSRYLNEEHIGFAEQLAFDDALTRSGCVGETVFGPPAESLIKSLASNRLEISGLELIRSRSIPDIDDRCGRHLRYRALIECGETQSRLSIKNLPKNVETYNALYDLATCILDPTIDYFGGIRLTYGLCTSELGRHIKKRISHELDQHAACELKQNGRLICDRQGAACDFIVDDEDMLEVARWITLNLPFDRLYYYGMDSPIHVSFGPNQSRVALKMIPNAAGMRLPRPLKFE